MDYRKAEQFNRLLVTGARQANQKTTIYIIEPGDSLSKIISDHYRLPANTLDYKIAEASVLQFNRHIKNSNKIRTGDIIRLMPLPNLRDAGQCIMPDNRSRSGASVRAYPQHRIEPLRNDRSARVRDVIPNKRSERHAFRVLTALEENHGIISTSVGGGINAFGNLVGQGNSHLVQEITGLYDDFQAGKMTRNQYDYRRQKVVKDLKRRMGPLFERDKLRIDRKKGVVATHKIEKHAKRIARLSRYATRGGVVLAGVGAAMSCRDIAKTENRQEKNEILVETTVSTIVGLGSSAFMSIVLASNPAGWGLAIILGMGSAAAAYGSGKFASNAYSIYGNEIDFVSGLGVDEVCK